MTRSIVFVALLAAAGCKGTGGPAETKSSSSAAPTAPVRPDIVPPEEAAMPIPASSSGSSSAAPAYAVTATEGLPAELAGTRPLWESARAPTTRQTARATRLYPDGRLYTFSNTRRALANGKPTRQPAPPAWRLDAQIAAAIVTKIEGIVRDRFVGTTAAATAKSADAGVITWRAWIDGKEHVVTTPTGATSSLPTPIAEIEQALQTGIVPSAVPVEQ
jgi:hypothetical protein